MHKIKLVLLSTSLAGGSAAVANPMKVSEISFKGNSHFTSAQLKNHLGIKEGEWFDLDKKTLEDEVTRLNYAYFNDGFVQLTIEPPKMVVAADKQSARVEFALKEGTRYKVGHVWVEGKCTKLKSDPLAVTQLPKQPFFNYSIMQEDIKALEAKCGTTVQPVPRTRIREADGEVDVSFELTEKKKS